MQADKPLPEGLTLDNILLNFATDEKARKFLEAWLWPNGAMCPRCKSSDPAQIYKMTGKSIRAGLYNCRECKRAFTVTVGTIFEDSHIPLRKWIIAWFLICSSKKGMSSLQLKRILDLGSYRTALFMTHRIRHALKDPTFDTKLSGSVEMDETYVGGKYRHGKGTGKSNKTPVVALVQRGGDMRSMVMERVTGENLRSAIREHVEVGSIVCTDDFNAYRSMPKIFTHKAVKHSAKEYTRREGNFTVHTNTVESAFSLLKRGVIGTFHSVSKHHLHFYLSEFDYRWNTRKTTDGERTITGLQKARGKRLTYRAIKGQRSA
jgi:transposase-like protein